MGERRLVAEGQRVAEEIRHAAQIVEAPRGVEEHRHAPPAHALLQPEDAEHVEQGAVSLEDVVIAERKDAVVVREAPGEATDGGPGLEHRDGMHARFRQRTRGSEPAQPAADDDDASRHRGPTLLADAPIGHGRSSLRHWGPYLGCAQTRSQASAPCLEAH